MAAAKPEPLELEAVIGFAGHVPNGLILHKDQKQLIYPLGSTIIFRTLLKNDQQFLIGHENPVSCVAINEDATLLATGEEACMGFVSAVIVWDLKTMERKYTLNLHKGKVQDLCFSHNSEYLTTLGGEDDNKLILWDLKTGEAICGSTAANDSAKTVRFFNNDNETIVTAGRYHIRTWKIDRKNRKMRPNDCKLGQIKRIVNCVCTNEDDSLIYAGTQSGDVLCIHSSSHLFKCVGPRKKPFSCGIRCMCFINPKELLIASGNGTIALMDPETLRVIRRVQLDGRVTSLQLNAERDHAFIGTDKCNIYCLALDDFEYELRRSSHYKGIHNAAFPPNYSSLFVTASNDIRVWNRETTKELLRISIPNCDCKSVAISHDGKQIISGWSDGKIRAFLPKTGRLIYAINDAHSGGVNAINICSDGIRVVSGGDDGRVRLWHTTLEQQKLMVTWKEHKCPVTHIELNSDETVLLSSSGDGSCIVWDLVHYNRLAALFAPNKFTHVLYHPDQSQILTTGTDRKISWWDAVDMEPIRILEGSESASINSLSIRKDGECFVSGGADEEVKLWKYDDGYVTHVGKGHSGPITCVCIAPDGKHIVSVAEESGIFIWKFPENMISKN